MFEIMALIFIVFIALWPMNNLFKWILMRLLVM